MDYGRSRKKTTHKQPVEAPNVPTDHKLTNCDCCGCYVVVKPKADLPKDCPACRHGQQATKRRIRRS